jgi:hypothetical protein
LYEDNRVGDSIWFIAKKKVCALVFNTKKDSSPRWTSATPHKGRTTPSKPS